MYVHTSYGKLHCYLILFIVVTWAVMICLIYVYALSPQAASDMYHFWHFKYMPKYEAYARSLYIVTGTHCDSGTLL